MISFSKRRVKVSGCGGLGRNVTSDFIFISRPVRHEIMETNQFCACHGWHSRL